LSLTKWILTPFSVLYHIATGVRNFLYDNQINKSIRFDIKTIGVGNLRVGGTGKTPHIEYLIRLLEDKFRICTLSRGYGRKTKGFLIAGPATNAEMIGDEPMQIYAKFKSNIQVAVGEKRALAIPKIQTHFPDINLILLDDVFQHRAVIPHCTILLTEYARPFYSDLILPAGRLREARTGAKRADIIIVTKCPDNISEVEMQRAGQMIRSYSRPDSPIFFTGIKYGKPVPISGCQEKIAKNVLLVSGIANPDKLEHKVKEEYNMVSHLRFADHYSYTTQSIKEILKQFQEIPGNDKSIVLTEKDMVKWKKPELYELYKEVPVFYLPIEIYFLKDKAKFDTLILQMLEA